MEKAYSPSFMGLPVSKAQQHHTREQHMNSSCFFWVLSRIHQDFSSYTVHWENKRG